MRIADILASLACGLALAACADRSPTSPATSARAVAVVRDATPVPFKLHCDMGNFQQRETQVPTDLRLTMEGNCLISHLGSSTVFIDQTDALDRMEGPVRYGHFLGHEVITAANGDELRVQHQGPTTIDFVTGAVAFGGEIVFEGGTGRFAHASGSGTFTGQANIYGNVGSYGIDAEIIYGGRAEP